MRSVLLTDGGAGAIWFFGLFVLVGVLGFVLIVVKALVPAAGGSDADRGFAIKVAAVWIIATVPFVGGFIVVWQEVCEVRVEDDGSWSLRNPVAFELGAIGGGLEREVRVRWLSADEVDHHESLTPHQPVELTVETADGAEFELYADAGGQGVLERLGYVAGGPCADPKNGQEFPRHTYTKRGPWCPKAAPGAGPADAPAGGGDPVFAVWSKDGWWYPAHAGARDPAKGAQVTYSDGSQEWRQPAAEFGPRSLPPVAHLQADWGGKGKYFPCIVGDDLGAGRYEVEYADGSKERVTNARLRFRLPKPDDLVFAQAAGDGWWYASTVRGASLDGLVVRPAGHEADERKTWDQILPLQLPNGAAVEVGGKAATVVAHAGTQAKIRYRGDSSEAMVAVDAVRFQPRKR